MSRLEAPRAIPPTAAANMGSAGKALSTVVPAARASARGHNGRESREEVAPAHHMRMFIFCEEEAA